MKYVYVEELKSNKLWHFYGKAYWCYDYFLVAPLCDSCSFFPTQKHLHVELSHTFPTYRDTDSSSSEKTARVIIGLTESESHLILS